MIPIIATRNTEELEEAIAEAAHGGRPLLGASEGIDPTIYANETATAEKAPYLLAVKSDGAVSPEDLAAAMALKSGRSEIDMRMLINSTCEVIENFVRQYGAVRIETPYGVLETRVSGSVESATDPIDPERHHLYLSFTPNDALKRAVKGLAYFNASERYAPFKVGTVRQAGTEADMPFAIGSDVVVHGSGFGYDPELSVSLRDVVTGVATPAVVKSKEGTTTLVVTIPSGLNVEHKHVLIVTQTIDGEAIGVEANKPFTIEPSPLPDHEITLVKHGSRDDGNIAFDENQNVVVTVRHNHGAPWALTDEAKKAWIVLDEYPDPETGRPKTATLDQLRNVSGTETQVTFKNYENTTELIDGDYWGHTGTLYIKFSDGKTATAKVNFVQY